MYKCLICDNYIPLGKTVCNRCREKLSYYTLDSYMALCPVCSYPLIDHVYSCPRCALFKNFPIFSIFDYRCAFLRHILESYKFESQAFYSKLFAYVIDDYLKKKALEHSVLVPVPCSEKSKKRRGWDHMEKIGLVLKRKYGYRVLPLLKNADEKASEQKNLTGEERSRKKYDFNPLKGEWEKESIIIIDDITTTGFTLQACRAELKAHGFRKIKALTVFKEL